MKIIKSGQICPYGKVDKEWYEPIVVGQIECIICKHCVGCDGSNIKCKGQKEK